MAALKVALRKVPVKLTFYMYKLIKYDRFYDDLWLLQII